MNTIETLKYCKVRNVKSPTRAHQFDAGMDWFVPEDLTLDEMREKELTTGDFLDYKLDQDKKFIVEIHLKPGQSTLIPSGIKVKVPDGYAMIYDNKSGVASKKHLLVGSSVVDIGYEGICHLNLHNVSNRTLVIKAGDKIVQSIMYKIGFNVPEEVKDEHELYGDEHSERSDGGFGSTGTK